MRLIRDNATRADFLGINVFRAKLTAFVIAGMIAGVGGMLMALFVSGAYPNFGFWTTSGEAIFMILMGGSNVFLGPVLGTVMFRILNDMTVAYTDHTDLVLGVVILCFVFGLRKGVLDIIGDRIADRRQAALRGGH